MDDSRDVRGSSYVMHGSSSSSPTEICRVAFKIKLRAAGYRLVYRVEDDRLIVIVVAVGRRARNLVYKIAVGRVDQ